MTFDNALASLDSFVNYEARRDAKAMREIRLGRMQQLCQHLGDPQRRFRSVLVAGTNGKGSICALLYSMLRESSLRVGLYTSPHLENFRERIRVWIGEGATRDRTQGDDWIDEASFAAITEQLLPVAKAMGRSPDGGGAPTYFEMLTAIAFLYFQQRHVDVAVIEVGLGGRLDATNVLEPAVAIFGPIGLDHVDVLGSTPEEIAREKAGIVKSRQLVLTAPQAPEVMAVLAEACEAQGAPLLQVGTDLTVRIHRHSSEGLQVSLTALRGIYESLEIPLLGRHQADNAVLAIGALEALSATGVPASIVERGLSNVEWPGRLEVVHERPLVILDGAHNPQAAQALADTLEELYPGRPVHLLVGMSSDKSVEGVGEKLGRISVGATCTKSRHPRALNPTVLATHLGPYCPDVHVMSDAVDAYTYLLNAVAPEEILVVTGSLFLVGELRTALRHAHVRPKRAQAMETS